MSVIDENELLSIVQEFLLFVRVSDNYLWIKLLLNGQDFVSEKILVQCTRILRALELHPTQTKLRELQEHVANQRKDFTYKQSRKIANSYDAACVDDSI